MQLEKPQRLFVFLAAFFCVNAVLAEFALKFTSYEYFWLAALGLSCAIFIALSTPSKMRLS